MRNLRGKLQIKKFRQCKKASLGLSLVLAILISLGNPGVSFAWRGDSGYEGGISSGDVPSVATTKTSAKIEYQYKEPCFLSGVPVDLVGTLVISNKSLKTDAKTGIQTLTAKYVYTLANTDKGATLGRDLTFVTTITPKANGQKTESTRLTKVKEDVKVDGVTYSISKLSDYSLSKVIITDFQPAVNYYQGNLLSKKTYKVGTTTDTVVVDTTSKYTGYDEYWSASEAQLITQTISKCKPGKSPVTIGTADIDISTTTKKELKYYDNVIEPTSIEGGYVQTQKNENILKYTAKMSELDKNKNPTSKINTYANSLKIESFPISESLVSPNLNQIKGHLSEKNIRLLFGLEAYKDTIDFDSQEYMSRAEFIDAFINVAKVVPVDPIFITKPKTTSSKKKVEVTSLFTDVSSNHAFFNSINEAATRGIVSGNGKSKYRPEDLITLQEAITMMINSMGLNGLAPNPSPVTSFKDNDSISLFARPSMYVAEKIGLIEEDSKGYINPKSKVTKAKAADMMKAYIDYMSTGIRSEYMDKLLSY